MMTLIEEMRLAVLQIWQSLGFEGSSRTAAAVVPALVLGIALNVVALGVVDSVRTGGHARCQKTGLRSVARSEFVVVRAMVASAKKKICEGQRGLCAARQRLLIWRTGATRYRNEMVCRWSTHVSRKSVARSVAMKLPKGFGHCSRGAGSAT